MIKNIVIIGMPGSGKTTIGLLTSKNLNMKFVDMDKYIEEKENKTISEMFDLGEEYFRNAETTCAEELGKKHSLVIATGGGIVEKGENIQHLKSNSIIIYLNRALENIISDIDIKSRPMLKENINNIHYLYKKRSHLYKKYCDIEILNDKKIDDAVYKIIQAVNMKMN